MNGNSKKTVNCGFLDVPKHDFIIAGRDLLSCGCCLHTRSFAAITVIS